VPPALEIVGMSSYSEAEKEIVYRVISERRDMRHFTHEAVDPEILKKLIYAAQLAPSVGFMQPWRFIRITDSTIRDQIYDLAQAEIKLTGEQLKEKKTIYATLKLEGIKDCAEVWVAALMEGRDKYILGRRTMPEMDLASLSCAIQNIWLAARAEGIGMGWVSFFKPDDLASLLSMPADSYPAAVLCIGHVKEFYSKPLLEQAEWDSRRAIDEILYENTWGNACSIINDP
jgi:5,6-dimethylbenzimidazole synthase